MTPDVSHGVVFVRCGHMAPGILLGPRKFASRVERGYNNYLKAQLPISNINISSFALLSFIRCRMPLVVGSRGRRVVADAQTLSRRERLAPPRPDCAAVCEDAYSPLARADHIRYFIKSIYEADARRGCCLLSGCAEAHCERGGLSIPRVSCAGARFAYCSAARRPPHRPSPIGHGPRGPHPSLHLSTT